MRFQDFLNQAWNDHFSQSPAVALRILEEIPRMNQDSQIPQMAHLITHVWGEHLGQWDQGIKALRQLQELSFFDRHGESAQAIQRSIASLELAGGNRKALEELTPSDQIRALAVTTSALAEQKKTDQAQQLFREALALASQGLTKEDPACRALAITGNNLASSLEEKPSLSPAEIELMILSAQTGRKYWELAGTWLHVERAEYRLAKTFLKANDPQRSLQHAQKCLELSRKNEAPALELFFGAEALTMAEKANGNALGATKALAQAKEAFERLSQEDKSWCEPTLKSLLESATHT